MKRKTKIRCVVALIVLGIIAMALWLRMDREEVQITYAGIPPNDPERVSFTITNRSKTLFFGGTHVQEPPFRVVHDRDGSRFINWTLFNGQSAVTNVWITPPTNRWRVVVGYFERDRFPFVEKQRQKLSDYAGEHGWKGFGQWMQPQIRAKYIYGQEMLGHKPAPPEQK